MPMYDFECNQCGGRQEHFVPFEKADEPIPCDNEVEDEFSEPGRRIYNLCGGQAVRVPSLGYEGTRNAQRFTPTVIHRDPRTGAYRLPASADAPVPRGFQKVELDTVQSIRKFEKQVNESQQSIATARTGARADSMQEKVDTNRKIFNDLKQNFSPAGRAFAELAQKKTDATIKEMRQKGKRDPGFHVEAFSQDASNREGHRDASNEWGKLRGSGK